MNNNLISREALKKAITELNLDNTSHWSVIQTINDAPTVPLPDFKEGYKQAIIDGKANYSRPHWIKIFENPYTNGYVCSVCGHEIHVTEQFLPKVTECEGCGADIRKGGNE